ncbi:MAG: hypothetical protein ACRCWI_01500 [Brevinema sp.]
MKFLILFLLVSCSSLDNKTPTEKILTKNIPSTDKLIREGRNLNTTSFRQRNTTEYNLIERLYDTVWYQTEEEFDDGKLETETKLVIFNKDSSVVDREIENGIMEKIDDDDFSALTDITDVTANGVLDLRNAVVALHHFLDGDREYKGYWLKDEYNLYIVEGDTKNEATAQLQKIMKNPTLAEFLDTEKYLLSTNK